MSTKSKQAKATTGPTLKLTERDRRFVDGFMGVAGGNAAKAARLAGFSGKNARHYASRLLTKANIRQALEEEVRRSPLVLAKKDRQEFWSAVTRGDGPYALLKMRDRLRASELLAKSHGDFINKHFVDAGESLYELLGGRPLPKVPPLLPEVQRAIEQRKAATK